MIDTHCHLNFEAFEGRVGEVIAAANAQGISHFIVPGTDIATSKKAIEITSQYHNVFAAVGIHPHHVFENDSVAIEQSLRQLEDLIKMEKGIVAIGEVGLDRHYYEKTKYQEYNVKESFIDRQKDVLEKQIKLAILFDKSLILHNREAKMEFLSVLDKCWDSRLAGRTVFHCCEPDNAFIYFARKHSIFIGVDGDVTFDINKQDFIKEVPLEMLVFETDAPFLTPEPVRSSAKKRPKNEPSYLIHTASKVAKLKGVSVQEIERVTSNNARNLFRLPK